MLWILSAYGLQQIISHMWGLLRDNSCPKLLFLCMQSHVRSLIVCMFHHWPLAVNSTMIEDLTTETLCV